MDPRIMALIQQILGGGGGSGRGTPVPNFQAGMPPPAPGAAPPEAVIQQLMQTANMPPPGTAPMPNPMGEDPGAMIDAGMGMVPDNQMAGPVPPHMMRKPPNTRRPSLARQPKPVRGGDTSEPSTRKQPKPERPPNTKKPSTSKQPKAQKKGINFGGTREGEGGTKKKKNAKQKLADQYD